MGHYIDGSWVDISSILVALVYAAIKRCRTEGQKWVSKATAMSVMHGIALFPLMLLALATFSSEALAAVLASNKIILSAAGLVALLTILEEPDA